MMSLVAAVALGLTLDRWRATEMPSPPPGVNGLGVGASHWLHALSMGRASCFIVAMALVLIPLRWMRPRPSSARVLRQPGAVACLAIVGMIAANLSLLALSGAIVVAVQPSDAPPRIYSNWYYWEWCVRRIPMGVIGAWTALALGGRWSPERSWIDRAGIALGLYWVALYLLGVFWVAIDRLLPYA